MSKRYNKVIRRIEDFIKEITDISEITDTIDARATAEMLRTIVDESKGDQGTKP